MYCKMNSALTSNDFHLHNTRYIRYFLMNVNAISLLPIVTSVFHSRHFSSAFKFTL